MEIELKPKKWLGRMDMSFNPFDVIEKEYQQQTSSNDERSKLQKFSQFDTVEKEYAKKSPNDFSEAYSPFDVVEKEAIGKLPEGWWDATARNLARTGSRMVETVLGLPGDFVQLAKWAGEQFPEPPSFLKQEPNFVQRLGRSALEQLPTQKSLQERSESLTGGYTAPQGPLEEKSDEVFKTLTGLLTGGGGKTAIQGATRLSSIGQQIAKVGRMLGMSVAAESAKEGVKLYGGSEGTQELGKLGALFLLGTTLPRLTGEATPENYLRTIYKERDALIPKEAQVVPTELQNQLRKFIENRLRFGGPTPEKTQVAGIAEKYLERLNKGPVEMNELLEMYRGINRNRSNVMIAPDLDKAGVKAARGYWGDMANMFNSAIEGYLAPISKQALDLHRAGNSGWASLNQSKRASNFIMDKIKGVPLKTGVATLFGGGVFYPATAFKSVGGAAIGAGSLKSAELAYRFLTNPTLRHYYNQVLSNAIRENGPATVKALVQLDKHYQKELNDPNSNLNRQMQPYPTQMQTKQQKEHPSQVDKTSLLYRGY